MSVDELLPYLREHRVDLLQQIRDGHYKAEPSTGRNTQRKGSSEIRNPGSRPGHPTGNRPDTDPNLRTQFSDSSFGFRPQTGAHDALKQYRKYANEGYVCGGYGFRRNSLTPYARASSSKSCPGPSRMAESCR